MDPEIGQILTIEALKTEENLIAFAYHGKIPVPYRLNNRGISKRTFGADAKSKPIYYRKLSKELPEAIEKPLKKKFCENDSMK
ncbi:hypothetical protein BpHYR1_023792 [Brachionus plicatilis]|uniref:Uncharacterized protein n=1 Tax=Brachionus plicatilis TaxID=10195 RepID=A0A3M7QHR2_BRAPC|nr:hypothetical protein BpHYR1_023792 [Brachionus plicatilis]